MLTNIKTGFEYYNLLFLFSGTTLLFIIVL